VGVDTLALGVMLNLFVRTTGIAICVAALFASRSLATTYVVDHHGGGQFTDIPPAIAAAQPGDVLLVMQGTYSGFTLDKGLAILGYGHPPITGTASIVVLPSSQTALLLNVSPPNLIVVDCKGPVIAQELHSPTNVTVQRCADVRFRDIDMSFFNSWPLDACDISGSRVEFVDCYLSASFTSGGCGTSAPPPPSGAGIDISHSSRVHLVRSSVYGGSGSGCLPQNYGADGGPGVRLTSSDVLIVAGGGSSLISGGLWGGDINLNRCTNNGQSGPGVFNQGGRFWHSGARFYCPDNFFGVHCIDLPCGDGITGPSMPVTPDDPTIGVTGAGTPGSTLHVGVRAPPGSPATLILGRTAVVIPDPNTRIEQLTPRAHIINLGTVPASGIVRYDWAIDTTLTPGTLFVGQATIALSPSDLRRTNSVPIIVR